ncbi:MAG TPA: murein L,D-transpeptidase catalytic domain family protein [Chitinophagaceae bacterium]|nr:murein L,D-transpeptidase catalytic domain family protein [Chitinophagaceae bacterium]HNU14137.1 murein L,D-transpeptidase catalytic domain family protein [Chitinophagaceae bacterium]
MRKLFVPISMGLLCTSFTIIPSHQTVNSYPVSVSPVSHTDLSFAPVIADAATALYNDINLQQYGLSKEAFEYAWKGYEQLIKKNMIRRSNYLTICDFSQSSKKKRLYIIDVDNSKLVTNTYVAHGKNSGGEFANSFSNKPESLQSSLGFYITDNTYIGKHGLSLRINGVDPGFNDKALMRTIVIHGADYVNESRVQQGGYMGRSWGCPAVPKKEATDIITTIKNGTCLFIYHPGKNYLLGSKILNG